MLESPCRLLVVLCCGLAACASVDSAADHAAVRDHIRDSVGIDEVHDPAAGPVALERLAAIHANGLGRDEACRLALLENRRLQAGFHALGVARADYEQAGLLQNPSLGLAFRVLGDATLAGKLSSLATPALPAAPTPAPKPAEPAPEKAHASAQIGRAHG